MTSKTVSFSSVALNASILPASIYGDAPYRTVPLLANVPAVMQSELQRLLSSLLIQAGVSEEAGMYFRIDTYLDPRRDVLWVLEVTTQYVDGWGVALNLLRACGHSLALPPAFPPVWVLDNPLYRPEIELDAHEIAFATSGAIVPRIITSEEFTVQRDSVYWYGWKAPDAPNIRPAHGRVLEDKIHLQRLSKTWGSHVPSQGTSCVRIPRTYMVDECSWEDLPFPVVCKNRRKNIGVYGNVALCRTRVETGKHARRAYERRDAVAQVYIDPYRHDGLHPTQLEILCIGTKPVMGYLLQGDRDTFILNDRVAHGPLILL